MRNEDTVTRENAIEALKVLDEIEEGAKNDPDYDVLPDAKRLNSLLPGMVYGKSTDHIRYICNEILGADVATA